MLITAQEVLGGAHYVFLKAGRNFPLLILLRAEHPQPVRRAYATSTLQRLVFTDHELISQCIRWARLHHQVFKKSW